MKSTVSLSNYEEFFLLYVDNELSAGERKAVEEFVRANPGLAVELEMLQQVQLTDETMIFEDKQELYRKESEEISLANYEEQFLLFVDKELAPDAAMKVERFVLQHPALQEGFTLLKQTRLEDETVVFANKASLYRKEEKEKPVFYLGWQRLAVAAALIGLMVLVWNVIPGNQNQPSGEAIAQLEKKNVPGGVLKNSGTTAAAADPSNKNENKSEGGISNQSGSPTQQTAANTTGVVVKNGAVVPANAVNTNNAVNSINEQPANTNNTLIASNTEVAPVRAAESAKGETVTDNHNSFQTVVTGTQKVATDHSALENHAITASNTDVASGGPNNNEVQPAVYRELDTEDEKKSLLLGSLEINKDKLRGFFRKAGSIFRSKSKNEDEKTESRPSSNTRSLK